MIRIVIVITIFIIDMVLFRHDRDRRWLYFLGNARSREIAWSIWAIGDAHSAAPPGFGPGSFEPQALCRPPQAGRTPWLSEGSRRADSHLRR